MPPDRGVRSHAAVRFVLLALQYAVHNRSKGRPPQLRYSLRPSLRCWRSHQVEVPIGSTGRPAWDLVHRRSWGPQSRKRAELQRSHGCSGHVFGPGDRQRFESVLAASVLAIIVCMRPIFIGHASRPIDKPCHASLPIDIIYERTLQRERGKRASEMITYCALTDLHTELSVRLRTSMGLHPSPTRSDGSGSGARSNSSNCLFYSSRPE